MKFISTMLVLFPALAFAQSSGWGALGESLANRNDTSAYDRAYREAVEREEYRQRAISLGNERAVADAVSRSRAQLERWWVAYGIPQAEARSIAAIFVADPRQPALNARAHRVGYEATVQEAIDAYQRFDYLLANQLLVAAHLLPNRP